MEKHVFKFGAGSWAMIVPKAWVDKNSVDEKTPVDVQEDEYGNIVVSCRRYASKEPELLVSSETDPETLGRWVVMLYRQGAKRLRVYSKGDDARRQFEAIEDTVTRRCPGFEVTSRSAKAMVFEDFNDMRQISIEKLMSRLRSLVGEELEEIGTEPSAEILKLENLVNRFFSLAIRYNNMVQGRNATNYFKIFQLLETISDQLYILSQKGTAKRNPQQFQVLKEDLDLCFKGLEGDHYAIGRCVDIKNSIVGYVLKTKSIGDLESYLMAEVAKNIMKVAELGLEITQKELAVG